MTAIDSTAFHRKQAHRDIPRHRSSVGENALFGSSPVIGDPAPMGIVSPRSANNALGTYVDLAAQTPASFDVPIDPVVARVTPLASAVLESVLISI